jgi:hypothetical protein
MTRSNFPNKVDSLPELSNILASDQTNIDRYKTLLMQATRTSDEETELSNLKTTLATKLIDAEYFNFLSDAIVATQNYFLNQVKADLAKLDVGVLRSDLGLLTDLSTLDRSNLVSAINEVQAETDSVQSKILDLSDNISGVSEEVSKHESDTSNPHNTTASQVGAYSKIEADARFTKGNYTIQSGLKQGGTAGITTVTYPKSFSTAPMITVTPKSFAGIHTQFYIINATATSFQIYHDTQDWSARSFYWIAVGN